MSNISKKKKKSIPILFGLKEAISLGSFLTQLEIKPENWLKALPLVLTGEILR